LEEETVNCSEELQGFHAEFATTVQAQS